MVYNNFVSSLYYIMKMSKTWGKGKKIKKQIERGREELPVVSTSKPNHLIIFRIN